MKLGVLLIFICIFLLLRVIFCVFGVCLIDNWILWGIVLLMFFFKIFVFVLFEDFLKFCLLMWVDDWFWVLVCCIEVMLLRVFIWWFVFCFIEGLVLFYVIDGYVGESLLVFGVMLLL